MGKAKLALWLGLAGAAAAGALAGCRQIKCEEFQLGHPLMRWHWFADLQPGYTFVNGRGQGVQLQRTEYEQSGAEKRWCHQCACSTELRTDYACEALGTLFQCDVDYSGAAAADARNGNVYYGVNRLYSAQRGSGSFHSRDSTLAANEGPYSPPYFGVRRCAAVVLLTTTVADVLELSVLDTAQAGGVEQVRVKPGAGMIAFQRRGEVWLKQ